MKFNRIKNKLTILLIAGYSLSPIAIHAMERERAVVRKETNIVAPYINAGASFAVARYVPDIAESMLPRVLPANYDLATTLVPPMIKYGAYTLGAHYILKKGFGINYSDLLKANYLKQVATTAVTVAPNLAPATFCHPQIARTAADYCAHLAASYLSDSQLQTLKIYAAPGLMVAGALGTAYLVNRNVFNNQLLKKAKRIWKDIRPYSFVAPLAVSYNADAVKNYVMPYIPTVLGKNFSSDMGSGIKAGVYWGGIGIAAYLFATQTLDLATQSYVKKQIKRLLDACSQMGLNISNVESRVNNTQLNTAPIRAGQAEQIKEFNTFSEHANKTVKELADILKQVTSKHTVAEAAIQALENQNANLITQAKNIGLIAAEVAENIKVLKEEHAHKMERFRIAMKDNGEQLLKVIAQRNKEVEEKIVAIENACAAETDELNKLQPKLAELLELLHQEGQTYYFDRQEIASIVATLQNSSVNLDEIINALGIMHAALETSGK